MSKIKKLRITAEKIDYICESDFAKIKDLEVLEFHCHNEVLEIDIDTFNNLTNFLKV